MNFLSILKPVGKAAEAVGKELVTAAPFIGAAVGTFNQPLGALISGIGGKLQAAIVNAEATITQAKAGALKNQTVVSDIESGLSIAQELLGAEGKAITYDPVALQAAINSQVDAFNKLATLHQSFKIVPVAQTPVATAAPAA